MSGYQFIHVEGYSRSGSNQTIVRKSKLPKRGDLPTKPKSTTYSKWSISQIADEALRVDGACDHVEKPHKPTVLHGVGVREAVADAETWAAEAKDSIGRALRKDGQCLLAGVVSLPSDRASEWDDFKTDCVEWLKSKYGERLRCVIEHTDETHPHLHFYAVPLPGERFEAIHAGKLAVAKLKAAGIVKKGDQNIAYKQAMRGFQDDFWGGVAVMHGLARKGPGKRRLGRAEWVEEQAAAKAKATILQALKQNLVERAANYAKMTKDFIQKTNAAASELAREQIDKFFNSHQADKASLASEREALAKGQAALERAEERAEAQLSHANELIGQLHDRQQAAEIIKAAHEASPAPDEPQPR